MAKALIALLSLAWLSACAGDGLAPLATHEPPLAALPTPTPQATPAPQLPQRRPVDEERPVKVVSKSLRYDNQERLTVFYGGVTVTQDTTRLLAQELRSGDGGRSAHASGGVKVTDDARRVQATAGQVDYSDALQEASFGGGLVLVSVDPYGAPLTVTGQEGRYWGLSRNARVDGGVRLLRGALSATAKSAEMEEGGGRLRLLDDVDAILGGSRAQAGEVELSALGKRMTLKRGVRAKVTPKELRQAAASPWAITSTSKGNP